MVKLFKFISLLAVSLVSVLVLALVAFQHLVQIGEIRRILIREMEDRTRLTVSAGEANFHIGRVLGVTIEDVVLSRAPNSRPVVVADKVLIRIALLPLLHRKVTIDSLVFYNPEFHFSRGSRETSGGPPLVELISVMAGADFREIGIEGGEIIFRDRLKNGRVLVTYFHKMDLNLRLVKAEEVSPLRSGPGVTAFAYSVSATVERRNRRAGFAAEGEIVFLDRRFEIRQTWVDARIAVESFPASLLHDYLFPSRGLNGVLSASLHWQGRSDDGFRLDGEVDFQRLKINLPDLLPRIIELGNGRLKLEMGFSGREIQLKLFKFRSSEVSFSAEGLVRSIASKDPYLNLKLKTPFLPLSSLRRLLPPKALKTPPWSDWIKGVKGGEGRLTLARVNGRLSEIRRLTGRGSEDRLSVQAEVRGVHWDRPADRFLPVRGISGRVSLENGILHFSRFKGSYGKTLIQDIEGKLDLLKDSEPLEVRVRGEFDLTQLWEQVQLYFLPPHIAKATKRVGSIDGRAKFVFYLRTDFKSTPKYKGQILFNNTAIRVGNVSVSKVHGNLSFSPVELRTGGLTFMVEDAPLRVGGALTNYQSDNPTLNLFLDSTGVRAGALTHMLFSVGSPTDPGTVSGKIRYRGSLGEKGKRQLTGFLKLTGVRLPLRLFMQPVQEVTGRMIFDSKGVDLAGFKGQVGGYDFDFRGRWSYGRRPLLTFTSSALEMDFTGLLPREKPKKPPPPAIERIYNRMQVRGKIRVARGGYKGFRFSDLKTDLTLNRRRWLFDNFSAKSGGGTIEGTGTFVDQAGELSFSVEPKIHQVPVSGVLGLFGREAQKVTGRVDLSGIFKSSGKTLAERTRRLSGAFKLQVNDGVIRKMALLVRILSLIDLSRWFTLKMPDINQEGIRFTKISADFKITNGVYSTRNLVVDGDELRISGVGKIDGAKGDMNFVIAMRPFPKIDSAVSHIPLIGKGIAGIKNSLLVASFRIRGPVDKPSITPAPLRTLSEFFFGALSIPKDLISLPVGDEK